MMPNMTMTLGEGEPAAGPWQVVALAQLVRTLRPRDGAPSGRPWVLAVDGRSGSGKTTLAERIWGAVGASTWFTPMTSPGVRRCLTGLIS
jgi:hypothetical protein